MKTIRIKVPTIEDVEFTISALDEHTPVVGNAMSSGDKEADRRDEQSILYSLENGNEWAWCCVQVTAKYRGMEGVDYLGCCSYNSESDFKKDGYYQDMKDRAFDDLINQIQSLK